MRIFIIHKGSDYERIEIIIKEIQNKTNADFLMLTSKADKKNVWMKEAKNKIKNADVILYMMGDESYKSKNIDYEIKIALKYKKQILLCRLNPNQKDIINDVLFYEDKYMSNSDSTTTKPLFKEISLDDLPKFIKYGYGFDISYKLDDTRNPKRDNEIIEQYKVYLETSEQLLNRRQNTSNFYTTLNTSLLTIGSTISAVILGLKIIDNNLLISGVLFLLISILGIMLCINWINLLDSYGKLNSSKIRVISEIEKRLPVNIYDTEWKIMSEKLGDTKYVSFTNLEKRIPFIFITIYSLILIFCTIAIIYSLVY